MSRLTSGEAAAIGASVIRPFSLIKFEFDSGTLYYTDYGYDISYDSQTWEANGFVLKTPDITEVFDFQNKTVSLQLSNVNQSFLAIVNTEQTLNRKVSVYRGLLVGADDSSMSVEFVVPVFIGNIEGYSSNASSMTLNLGGLFNDFQRTNGRMMTAESQKRFDATDKGFEFASQNNKQIVWGTK